MWSTKHQSKYVVPLGAIAGVVALALSLTPRWNSVGPAKPRHSRVHIVTASGAPLKTVFDGITPDARNLRNWAKIASRPRMPSCKDAPPETFLSRAMTVLGFASTVHAQSSCFWVCGGGGCGAWIVDTACQGTQPCNGTASNGYTYFDADNADESNSSHCHGTNCAGCWATNCSCPDGGGGSGGTPGS